MNRSLAPSEPDELSRALAAWLAEHRAALRARWLALEEGDTGAEGFERALGRLVARLAGEAQGTGAAGQGNHGPEALARLLPVAEGLMQEEGLPDREARSTRLAEAILELVVESTPQEGPRGERLGIVSPEVESLLEAVSDPVALIEVDTGRIVTANAAAVALSGYPREKLMGMTAAHLQPRLSAGRLRAVQERLQTEGELFYERYPLRRSDGEELEVSMHASLVERGGKPAVLAVIRPEAQPELAQAELAAQAVQLRQELAAQAEDQRRLRQFFENVIDALPLRLLVLDADLRIMHANPAYYQQRGFSRDQVIGQHITEVFHRELLEEAGLRRALEGTLATGERVWWSGFREHTPGHAERIVNIRIDPCRGADDRPCLLITIEDVSERYRQIYERTILQEISRVMLGTLQLPRLLHAILTGISAGGAAGLGFNRAILMLVDEEAGALKAEMAVGPESVQQAHSIWSEVSGRYRTLHDFLEDYDELPPPEQRPLHELVSRLVVPLGDAEHLPISALVTGETVHVIDASHDPRVNPDFARVLESEEFVVAPLLVGERKIGVAVADNFVTKRAIRGSDIHLLTSLTNQAALAIDRAQVHRVAQERAEELAQAYEELKAAEQELLRRERLATIGQVTAAVAHEIRNPLSTIGGFGRSILRDPADVQISRRAAGIIVEEADRLEELLRNLLDFSRPQSLQLQRMSLKPLVEKVLELTAESLERSGVETVVELPEDLPEVELDRNQFQQVIFNLVQNALEAMPQGGRLTLASRRTERGVELEISDTGLGILPENLDRVFESYFTTKPTGTGLGLALARKILDAHQADIEVKSSPEGGTAFTIVLPYSESRAN